MSDFCEIVVKGQLDIDWSEWFEGLTIAHNDKGETILSGQIRDQTVLYGIIAKARDLGLSLVSVKCIVGESKKENDDSNDNG
jgi:hypothetical protein